MLTKNTKVLVLVQKSEQIPTDQNKRKNKTKIVREDIVYQAYITVPYQKNTRR